jgi:hypothetical protein
MIKKLLLRITRVISAGWCAECWLGGARRTSRHVILIIKVCILLE